MQGTKKNEVFGINPVAIARLLTFACQSKYLVFPNHFVYYGGETERVR